MDNLQDCEPKVTLGEKNVRVRSLTMGGLQRIAEALKNSNLPAPTMGGLSIKEFLNETLAAIDRAASGDSPTPEQLALAEASAQAKIKGAIVDLLVDNGAVLKAWFFNHGDLVKVVFAASTNLDEGEIETLRLADAFIVLENIVRLVATDGTIENATRFFGGLFGMMGSSKAAPNS